jgi:hypothetical protein
MANLTATAIARGMDYPDGTPLQRRSDSMREAVEKAARPNAPYERTRFEGHDEEGQPVGSTDLISDSGEPWMVSPAAIEDFNRRWVQMTEAFRESEGHFPGPDDEQYWSQWKNLMADFLRQPHAAAPEAVRKAVRDHAAHVEGRSEIRMAMETAMEGERVHIQ